MRNFSSYGPINTKLNYYAPRKRLIQYAYERLTGQNFEEGGHYITVWAPRQTGKTWIMQQVMQKIKDSGEFDVGIVSMQSGKTITTDADILDLFVKKLNKWFKKDLPAVNSWQNLSDLFVKKYFKKPVILILDEFDALGEDFINKFANEFRDMYLDRQNESEKPSEKKACLLHSLALIGVRSVLGIEDVTGSPFNVQRSLHISNLTFEEVKKMFAWCEKESDQKIEPEVVKNVFRETQGQPGLTCWFGELLTEGFSDNRMKKDDHITMKNFKKIYTAATDLLPNNNILNIISKAKQKPYNETVFELFRTDEKMPFRYDDPDLNFLYLNGVIGHEEINNRFYAKFSCPFIQKRLFNYFANRLFRYMGTLREPFEDLSCVISENSLNIKKLMRRHEAHLKKNRKWLLKDAPRRKDMKIFEAVYHFNLFRYLSDFFGDRARVWPEFPTGNGQVDIVIEYGTQVYGLEIKSYTDETGYKQGIEQAARYGKQLGLAEVFLILFVEYVDDRNRKKYEQEKIDDKTGVQVIAVFVETGKWDMDFDSSGGSA
ncbi:AAA-like domain-containing protein [Desulfobacterales bacterium HSG16]|nr:AAA-like domain-containing protein [Desulfobacterales bacterium HSG16]